MLSYGASGTIVYSESSALDDFSTSSSSLSDDLNLKFKELFGDKTLEDVVNDYSITNYEKVIKKVIAMEMYHLLQSGDSQTVINAILASELDDFLISYDSMLAYLVDMDYIDDDGFVLVQFDSSETLIGPLMILHILCAKPRLING